MKLLLKLYSAKLLYLATPSKPLSNSCTVNWRYPGPTICAVVFPPMAPALNSIYNKINKGQYLFFLLLSDKLLFHFLHLPLGIKVTCTWFGFTRVARSNVSHIFAATAAQMSWSELGQSPAELIEFPSRSNKIVHLVIRDKQLLTAGWCYTLLSHK